MTINRFVALGILLLVAILGIGAQTVVSSIPYQQVVVSDGTNNLSLTSFEGDVSAPVVQNEIDSYVMSLSIDNIATTTGYMLIDLDDSASRYPHSPATDHVDIFWGSYDINPSTSYAGDISIGYLSNVVSANGTLNIVEEFHMEQTQAQVLSHQMYFPASVGMESSQTIGPTLILSAFGNGSTVAGPDGNTYTPKNGDVVLYVTRTAGNVDLNIELGYGVE